MLVVDDDERIRGLLQTFLRRNGFIVTAARDAAHARRLLAGLEFDLIVLDVMMPGEDGIALTAIAARGHRDADPAADRQRRHRRPDRRAGGGADDYLPKPFEPKELLLRINAILRRVPPQPRRAGPEGPEPGPGALRCGAGRDVAGRDADPADRDREPPDAHLRGPPGRGAVSRTQLVEDLGGRGRTAGRRRSGPSTCRSPACGARSRPIRDSRATCRRCAARATCWRRTERPRRSSAVSNRTLAPGCPGFVGAVTRAVGSSGGVRYGAARCRRAAALASAP